MENASKALIIAGAILLSIAIIGIGMSVFNGAQDAVNKANMSEAEITTFNGKFENYEGARVSGSRVRQLADTIRSHNNANIDDFTRQVRLVPLAAGADPQSAISTGRTVWNNNTKTSILTGESYRVVVAYNDQTGLIVEVGVQPLSGTNPITGTTNNQP